MDSSPDHEPTTVTAPLRSAPTKRRRHLSIFRAASAALTAFFIGAAIGATGYAYHMGATPNSNAKSNTDKADQIERRQGIARTLTSNYIDGINSGQIESLKTFLSASAYSDVENSNKSNVRSLIQTMGPAVINHFEPMVIGMDSVGGIISLTFGPGSSSEDWQFAYFQCSRSRESWQLDGMWLLVKP